MCSIMIVIYGESMKVTLTKTGGIIVVAPWGFKAHFTEFLHGIFRQFSTFSL